MSILRTKSDDIGNLRRNLEVGLAWDEILSSLSGDEDENTTHEVWLDHITGRMGDCYATHEHTRNASGCILWEYSRHIIQRLNVQQPIRKQRPDELRNLLQQLTIGEQTWVEAAKLQGYRKNHLASIECLIRGGFATCRAVVITVAELIPFPVDGYIPGETVWLEVINASLNYNEYWEGSKPENHVVADSGIELNRHSERVDLFVDAMEQFDAVLSKARKHLFTVGDKNESWDIACSMVRRAARWLLRSGNANGDVSGTEMMVLLLGTSGPPSCAWLSIIPEEGVSDTLCVFPDPISLGMLPFDSAWRSSFDNAVRWNSERKCKDQQLRRWSMRYLDETTATRLAVEHQSSRGLRRPLVQTGPSASAAFALQLAASREGVDSNAQVTVIGQVGTLGELAEVEAIKKLDSMSLWTDFLRSC